MADLEAQRDSSYAYTATPAHHLTSIAASATRFLDRNAQSPAQSANTIMLNPPSPINTREHNVVLRGLHAELNTYLYEPRMDLCKATNEGNRWCDPLLYWAVCIFPHFHAQLSATCVGCRKEIPISLSSCNGRPPGASLCSALRATLFFKQRNMCSSPEPYQLTTYGSTSGAEVFISFYCS